MSPLFVAYDDRIAELESEKKALQNALTDLRAHTEELVRENESLHVQVRDMATDLIHRGEQQASSVFLSAKTSRQRDLDEWAETQERIDLLTQENDLLLQQTRALQEELDRTRNELAASVGEQATLMQQLADTRTENEKLSLTLSNTAADAAQWATLQDELARCRAELSQTQAGRSQTVSDLLQQLSEARAAAERAGSEGAALQLSTAQFARQRQQLEAQRTQIGIQLDDALRRLRASEVELSQARVCCLLFMLFFFFLCLVAGLLFLCHFLRSKFVKRCRFCCLFCCYNCCVAFFSFLV